MMRKTLKWVIFELLFASQVHSQTMHKHIVATSDPTNLSINDGTSQELVYYQLNPFDESAVKGLLVLLPGLGAHPQNVFQETKLAQEAAQIGLITIVPSVNNRLYLDSASKHLIGMSISQVVKEYPVVNSNFFIGGFSAGGHLALAYAETVVNNSPQNNLVLKAAFGVDPPVDMRQFWQLGQRRIEKKCSKLLVKEGQNIISSLTHLFGGSPDEFPEKYLNGSAFSSIDSLGGNAHLLKSIPIRIYAEPDLDYWRKNFCKSFTEDDLTAKTSAMMMSKLQAIGNQNAQYIKTSGKGFIGKRRFPHSWSIVDVTDCILWMSNLM